MIRLMIKDVDDICKWYTSAVCDMQRRNNTGNRYIGYVIDNMESLVSCKAAMLSEEIRRFNGVFPHYSTSNDKEKTYFKKYMVEQYNRMLGEIGLRLHKRLDVKVCPYCNRQYTYTVKGQNAKSIHPEFDHFYPKSYYPYLALSFYNLIPSCHTCNTVKKTNKISINPYIEEFGDNAKFAIDRLDLCLFNMSGWRVRLTSDKRCKSNIDAFCLDELYAMYGYYAQEIALKRIMYNEECIKDISTFLKAHNISNVDVPRILFGNYVLEEDLGKRPLSKLTHDIIDQIAPIKRR